MILEPYKIETFKDCLGNEYYLVIDTLFKGVSGGGIRIHPDNTLQEVMDLARNMSYKFAIFDIPVGGAKIGIRLKDEAMKGEAIKNLKRYLRPFMKSYSVLPGKDLGITDQEVRSLCKGILQHKYLPYSSYYTAVGIIACLNFIKSQYGLKNIKVALAGFGSVGFFFLEKLIEQDINLVAISNKHGCIYKESGLDKKELLRLKKKFNNDEWIFHINQNILSKEILYTLPVDILIPGAEAYAISDKNLNHIKAKFICPIANIPYHKDILPELKKKKIIFFPDFVTNAGGVLGLHFLNWGFSFKETTRFTTSKITTLLNFLYNNGGDNYYEFALQTVSDKLKMRSKFEKQFQRNTISRLARNCFITVKEFSPKFLLRNYFIHKIQNK